MPTPPGAYHCECFDGYQDYGEGCELAFDQVSTGQTHTCAVGNGALYCWGGNEFGQLGLPAGDPNPTPTQVGTSTNWESVSAGGYHTCATTEGKLYCWGDNRQGQVGGSIGGPQLTPVALSPRLYPAPTTGGSTQVRAQQCSGAITDRSGSIRVAPRALSGRLSNI